MSTQNFKIKNGLSIGENEIIDSQGNLTLPEGASIQVGGAPLDALPDQANNSGKYLTTDGSGASWETITQYTPPTNQGAGNFLSGDGTYKAIDVTGQINTAVAALVDAAPETLDTLNELAAAIGDNPNFATTVASHTSNTSNPHNTTASQVGAYTKTEIDNIFNDATNLEYDNTLFSLDADNVQEGIDDYAENVRYWNNITSAVRMFGGIIQDNGDGTVRVSAGGGLFKQKASATQGVPPGECEPMSLNSGQAGEIFYHTWIQNDFITLTNNAYNYIFILWDHTINNGDGTYGNTRVYATTNFYLTDWENEIAYYTFRNAHPELELPERRSGMLHAFTIGRVYRMDNEITIRVCGTNGWNYNKRAQLFGEEFFPVVRARGLQIEAATGDLKFNVTEGIMWAEAVNRFTVKGFNMDEGDTFTSWYRHTPATVEMTLSTINDTYPLGITDSPYNVLYSSIDTKYYRWSPLFEGAEFGIWSEVIDYVVSKPNIKEKENLAEVQSLYPNGFHNFDDPNEDYVIVQLQATREYYRYDLGWQLYTGMKDAFVIINFLGTLDELETQYPNGYTGLINIIAPTSDGKFYEYNGTNGWERVHGYVNRSGWSRFYNQTVVDVTRYNDIPNNKIVDLPEDTYCVAWVYMVHDNSCHLVYGQDFYNFEEAQNASLPTPLPGLLAAYSTLVGKITYSANTTDFSNARLESPFQEKFISSGVSLHNDLAGLQGGSSNTNEFYHLTETEHGLISTFADVVDVNSDGDLSVTGNISSTDATINGELDVARSVSSTLVMQDDTIGSGENYLIPSGKQVVVDHLDVLGTLDVQGTLATTTGGYLSQTTMKTQVIQNPTQGNSISINPTGGYVGIGTDNPQHMLHLKGHYPFIAFEDIDNGATHYSTITGNSDGSIYYDANFNNVAGTYGSHRFRINGASKTPLTINENGYVLMPEQPAWHYSGGTTLTASSWVTCKPSSAVISSASYSTSTGKFTAPVPGKYFIGVWGLLYPNGSSVWTTGWFKNGVTVGNQVQGGPNSANHTHYTNSLIVQLSAGDTIEFKVYAGTDGVNAYSSQWNQFGYLIG